MHHHVYLRLTYLLITQYQLAESTNN